MLFLKLSYPTLTDLTRNTSPSLSALSQAVVNIFLLKSGLGFNFFLSSGKLQKTAALFMLTL